MGAVQEGSALNIKNDKPPNQVGLIVTTLKIFWAEGFDQNKKLAMMVFLSHLFFIMHVSIALIFLCCVAINAHALTSFQEDLAYIRQYDTPLVLQSKNRQQQIVISAMHQARILTSTAAGDLGLSNGWLNRQSVARGQGNVGGENRTWLAPIGSKLSVFYPPKKAITSENWRVPPGLKAQNYQVIEVGESHAVMQKKSLRLENHIGTPFLVDIVRELRLYTAPDIKHYLNIALPKNVSYVGFGSLTTLTNVGEDWHKNTGALAIWNLGMYQGTDDAVAIIPAHASVPNIGSIHQYLYPLDATRLAFKKSAFFYKVDGRYRSKVGMPAQYSQALIASYAPSLRRLTLIKFSFSRSSPYPIAVEDDVPLSTPGDVTNVYNHGGMNGELLGSASFYELETASPMVALKTGAAIKHTHQTFHFFGEPAALNPITTSLLGIPITRVAQAFSE